MFKLSITLFLTLLTASFTFAQAKSSDAIKSQIKTLGVEKTFSLNFDRPSNISKLLAFGEDFGRDQAHANGVSGLSFGMTFYFPGTELTAAPDSFVTTFWAQDKNRKFADAHHLTVTIDGGETLDLGDARYANKGEGTEYLNFNIQREHLAKIARGKDVRLKIGSAEFRFKPEHLKMFASLLAISDPLIR